MVPGWIVVVAGAAVLVTALLGKFDRLPRNHWAGIRTRTTMRDDDTWRAAHRASWPLTAIAGTMAIGLGLYMALSQKALPLWLYVVLLFVPTVIAGFVGQAAAKRVIESHNDQ